MNRIKKLSLVSIILLSSFCFPIFSANLLQTEQNFIEVSKRATPAVVSIQVKKRGTRPQSLDERFDEQEDDLDFFGQHFFRRFFRMPRQHGTPPPSVGGEASGTVISPDGFILTNNHVVNGFEEIVVVTNSGKRYEGKVIGQDENTDLAVIKIEAQNLPYLELGDSDKLLQGQWVLAVGNPLGLQSSVTSGIISATGRNNLDLAQIEDFIQTDAAVNRGNSGGPLLNLNGEVIGINTAIVSQLGLGGYMGIGFAIPSNMARNVMDQLIANGSVVRGFLGVTLQAIDQDLALALGLDGIEGALVAEVSPESPAESAGIKQGDIILFYNNIAVHNIASLRNAISMMQPGTRLSLTLKRDGKMITVHTYVGEFPTNLTKDSQGQEVDFGLIVENLTPEMAKQYGYQMGGGVMITKVTPGSVAEWAGLKKGSVILSVNKEKVTDVNQFKKMLKSTPEGRPTLLLIKQGEVTRFISLKIG